MRVSAVLRAVTSTLPWLPTLPAAKLQRIARATGIQSSGTKAALVSRIEGALHHGSHHADTNADAHRRPDVRADRDVTARPLSILSIDMGIRNLAFAHLRTAPSAGGGGHTDSRGGVLCAPELTAWHRLAVSEIAGLKLEAGPGAVSGVQGPPAVDGVDGDVVGSGGRDSGRNNESFSPEVYAASAYTLVSTLLAVYQPTHVLIERQRFRSGGGSAVQEWTLRVGVLEGMLYAVLHALRQERGGEVAKVDVQGIEPRRVMRYWMDGDGVTSTVEPGLGQGANEKTEKKTRLGPREVKKAKIDLVGRWVSASLDKDSTGERASNVDGVPKFALAEKSPAVRTLAQAYLQKWQEQSSKTRRRSSSIAGVSDIGKLDDLADCLLQGVAWLEWQVMRQQLRREGVRALEWMS
ncbi:uncharacterized protein N7459_009317 [Penicillium hispanicum]|uniref:uncharacterized protein n=1 Tax=Penicillium hispanicum TaxID=1080232 RepID=UPI00254176A3|nr:uncharacterized protein N7459_009317 [Penicillium hispanicum]KAJ5569887.1 hypothetical protein N7459_009317 [Penicillium hispanicum]